MKLAVLLNIICCMQTLCKNCNFKPMLSKKECAMKYECTYPVPIHMGVFEPQTILWFCMNEKSRQIIAKWVSCKTGSALRYINR